MCTASTVDFNWSLLGYWCFHGRACHRNNSNTLRSAPVDSSLRRSLSHDWCMQDAASWTIAVYCWRVRQQHCGDSRNQCWKSLLDWCCQLWISEHNATPLWVSLVVKGSGANPISFMCSSDYSLTERNSLRTKAVFVLMGHIISFWREFHSDRISFYETSENIVTSQNIARFWLGIAFAALTWL